MRKKDARIVNQEILNSTAELNYLNNDFNANNASGLLFGKDMMFEFAADNPGLNSGLLKISVSDKSVSYRDIATPSLNQLINTGLKKSLKNN